MSVVATGRSAGSAVVGVHMQCCGLSVHAVQWSVCVLWVTQLLVVHILN